MCMQDITIVSHNVTQAIHIFFKAEMYFSFGIFKLLPISQTYIKIYRCTMSDLSSVSAFKFRFKPPEPWIFCSRELSLDQES